MLSSEFLEHIWQNCIEMSSEKQKQQAAMNRHQGRFEVPGSNPKIDISEKVLKNIMNTVQEIGGSSRRVNIVSSGSLGKLHCVCLYVCLFICGSLWIIFLKKMCEMAPRLSPRAKESLGGSIWGSSQRKLRKFGASSAKTRNKKYRRQKIVDWDSCSSQCCYDGTS